MTGTHDATEREGTRVKILANQALVASIAMELLKQAQHAGAVIVPDDSFLGES